MIELTERDDIRSYIQTLNSVIQNSIYILHIHIEIKISCYGILIRLLSNALNIITILHIIINIFYILSTHKYKGLNKLTEIKWIFFLRFLFIFAIYKSNCSTYYFHLQYASIYTKHINLFWFEFSKKRKKNTARQKSLRVISKTRAIVTHVQNSPFLHEIIVQKAAVSSLFLPTHTHVDKSHMYIVIFCSGAKCFSIINLVFTANVCAMLRCSKFTIIRCNDWIYSSLNLNVLAPVTLFVATTNKITNNHPLQKSLGIK